MIWEAICWSLGGVLRMVVLHLVPEPETELVQYSRIFQVKLDLSPELPRCVQGGHVPGVYQLRPCYPQLKKAIENLRKVIFAWGEAFEDESTDLRKTAV